MDLKSKEILRLGHNLKVVQGQLDEATRKNIDLNFEISRLAKMQEMDSKSEIIKAKDMEIEDLKSSV